MLDYNEITPKKVILFEGEPYEVLESHVFRKQQRKPVNATKLRNVISGRVVEYSFHQSEKAEEADIEKRDIKYLYTNRGESWFCEANEPSKRFMLGEDVTGGALQWVRPNALVKALVFEEKIFGIEVPVKVQLKVKDAPPGVRGDTSKGGMKQVTLETGAVLNAPLFVETGDTLEINTASGEYVSRV